MATLVVTAVGNDQAGLVEALAGVVTNHEGNWDKSQMAGLAGKFVGIVVVTVPDKAVDLFVDDLKSLEMEGLLHITVATIEAVPSTPAPLQLRLELVGQDHPGIVHDISKALAARGVSIEELETGTESAPMAGGRLFRASAVLAAPSGISIADLRGSLEELANELMVDIDLSEQ